MWTSVGSSNVFKFDEDFTMELEVVKSYCHPVHFVVNGINASQSEFGTLRDTALDLAGPDGGCGNMKFTPYYFNQATLAKYNLTEAQYIRICEELETALSFGKCCWCV